MGRLEQKFVIDASTKKQIEHVLAPWLQRDAHGDSQRVISLYYDSPQLGALHDKLDGIPNRWKARARRYEALHGEIQDDVFLEIKNRNDLDIFKERERVRLATLAGGLRGLGQDPLKTSFPSRVSGGLTAVITVEYVREAFLIRDSEVRLTFDSELHYGWPEKFYGHGLSHPFLGRDKVIMELKSKGEAPEPIADLLARFELQSVPFSKYALALECRRHRCG